MRASSRAMRLLTTATDMRMSRPAAVKLPSSTTRTKIAMSSVSGIRPPSPGAIIYESLKMYPLLAQSGTIKKIAFSGDGGRFLGLGQSAAALEPCDARHRLDRHLLPFHLARRQPAPRGRPARGRLRRQLDGAWRRLLPRAQVPGGARPAPQGAALVQIRGLFHLGQRLPAAGRRLL